MDPDFLCGSEGLNSAPLGTSTDLDAAFSKTQASAAAQSPGKNVYSESYSYLSKGDRNRAASASLDGSKLYTKGNSYRHVPIQETSPKSNPNAGAALLKIDVDDLRYSDEADPALGQSSYPDIQYENPYSVPPQNTGLKPSINGVTGFSSKFSLNYNHYSNYDQLMQTHLVVGDYSSDVFFQYVNDLKSKPDNRIITLNFNELSLYEVVDPFSMNLFLSVDSRSTGQLDAAVAMLRSATMSLTQCEKLSFHIIFPLSFKWKNAPKDLIDSYYRFMDALKEAAGTKVQQCSIIRKYNSRTVCNSDIDALVALGKDISDDIGRWDNLRILDYSYNCLRLLPGVKLPDSLEVLNLGGSQSLETLAGFLIPPNLRVLEVTDGLLKSIDYVFPSSLRRLILRRNLIYSLDYVKLPPLLVALDLSENRIDTIKYVNFPRELTYLSIAHNPIECMKGARFPEKLEYLDISCIPNESMAGIKFPDSTLFLNLQLSMTSTRGLKLPVHVKELNMACDGVNSINPLKLPNSIEKLFLSNNNIKTLSKVNFPDALRELYLGSNLITSLKNVLFPSTLEVLDLDMNPDLEDNEKDISSLKDVILPANLRILRLGYHLIKAIESMEFPFFLEELSLQYNDLRMFRNVKFGPKLRLLDLSGNQELMSIDNVLFPETLVDMRIPSTLLSNLPANIVMRANKGDLVLTKSLPYAI